jgi:hypothetical protein
MHIVTGIKDTHFVLGSILEDRDFVSAVNIIVASRLGILLRLFEVFELNHSGIYAVWLN